MTGQIKKCGWTDVHFIRNFYELHDCVWPLIHYSATAVPSIHLLGFGNLCAVLKRRSFVGMFIKVLSVLFFFFQ